MAYATHLDTELLHSYILLSPLRAPSSSLAHCGQRGVPHAKTWPPHSAWNFRGAMFSNLTASAADGFPRAPQAVVRGTTVNIRLYSTPAHFVAPVPAMHACGARCRDVLESSAIVLVCTEIAADCGLKALLIAEFQHATGLRSSGRSLSDASNYLFDTRSAAIMCPHVRPRPLCPQIRKPHDRTRNPHSTSKRTFPDLPARPFRPHRSSLQPPNHECDREVARVAKNTRRQRPCCVGTPQIGRASCRERV